MSFSLFATVLCTALPSATPLEFPAQAQDGCVAVHAGVHVTPTHLVARNFSDLPQLLVFSDDSAQSLRALGAGASLELDFAREALLGARLELLSLDRGVWSFSGALDLSGALLDGEDTLWFQVVAGRVQAWSQSGAELTQLEPGESALPEDLRSPLAAVAAPACAPTHVPVVTPGRRPKGDLPPKLERRPLPPV